MLSRNKNGRSLLETKSHSVDLWLQDHFSDGAGSQDVGDNLNIGAGDKQSSGRTLGQRENHIQNAEDGGGNREKLGGISISVGLPLWSFVSSDKEKYISSSHLEEKYFESIYNKQAVSF